MRATTFRKATLVLALAACAAGAGVAQAAAFVQCPGDTDGDAIPNTPNPAIRHTSFSRSMPLLIHILSNCSTKPRKPE